MKQTIKTFGIPQLIDKSICSLRFASTELHYFRHAPSLALPPAYTFFPHSFTGFPRNYTEFPASYTSFPRNYTWETGGVFVEDG